MIALGYGECLCKDHRGRGLSIRFVESTTRRANHDMAAVCWYGAVVAGPFALLSLAEGWARENVLTWPRCKVRAMMSAALDCAVPG
jgi:hypothetical protein